MGEKYLPSKNLIGAWKVTAGCGPRNFALENTQNRFQNSKSFACAAPDLSRLQRVFEIWNIWCSRCYFQKMRRTPPPPHSWVRTHTGVIPKVMWLYDIQDPFYYLTQGHRKDTAIEWCDWPRGLPTTRESLFSVTAHDTSCIFSEFPCSPSSVQRGVGSFSPNWAFVPGTGFRIIFVIPRSCIKYSAIVHPENWGKDIFPKTVSFLCR